MTILSPITNELRIPIRRGRSNSASLKVLGSMGYYAIIHLKFLGFIAAGV